MDIILRKKVTTVSQSLDFGNCRILKMRKSIKGPYSMRFHNLRYCFGKRNLMRRFLLYCTNISNASIWNI